MTTTADTRDLAARIASLSPAKRALLEQRLKTGATLGRSDRILPRRALGNKAPMSFSQQRLWLLDQLEPGNSVYNVPRALRMRGVLNVEALQHTLDALVQRHQTLRTTFGLDADGTPVQCICDNDPVVMPLVDLTDVAESEREAEARRLAATEALRPFDLAAGPVIRASLLRLTDQDHILLLTLHHIVSDAWSAGVLVGELATLYDASVTGEQPALRDLPIQYADFAVWQRERLHGDLLEEQLAYWRHQLEGAPPVLDLPTDRPRPAMQTFRGARVTGTISPRVIESLKVLSQREGVTLFMTLLAAFKTVLFRHTHQDDIVIGTPIAARSRAEIESLIGCFTNTLALRTDLSGDPTFRTLLARVREVALGAYAHQDLPFERLVEELQPQRDLARNPVFQVLFVLQNVPSQAWRLTGLTLEELDVEWKSAKVDLTLYMGDAEHGGMWSIVEYNSDLFDAATIQRLFGHFARVLEAIVADPDTRLSRLPLLTSDERTQLLVTWNATAADYPRDAMVWELIQAQAEQTPDAVAVSDETETLTYAALQRRADQIAQLLRVAGSGRESLVGVCLERSVNLVAALLGVWKAGAAYVPLDPAYPPDRLAFVVEDARLPLVLTERATAMVLPATSATEIVLHPERIQGSEVIRMAAPHARSSDDLAYVIYTSGSTGQPKGVQISQRAVVNFLCAMRDRLGFSALDRLLAVTTFSFDIANLELWLPLLVGARVDIVSRKIAADGHQLRSALQARRTTAMQATPATWRLLIDAGWDGKPPLKVLCGGEALPRDLAGALCQRSEEVWNLYGPTETTIWSSALRVTATGAPPAIGQPIANTQLYVLDHHMEPVPIGVAGELYIGGDGLARGYLNRPELTAERFVRDPFSGDTPARLYKTGDQVRYRADGTLEFLGRLDQQVKLRGFRIELGEIEATLCKHPAVREAAVALHDLGAGDTRLTAYVVPESGATLTSDDLRHWVKVTVPDYMVPASFQQLDRLPLTPNGKVDRRALPAPERTRVALDKTFVAPRDALELQLAKLWEKVLKTAPIGVTDNFFDLGGHSLLAVTIFAQIQKMLDRNLPVTTLFQAPTIEQLATTLRQEGWSSPWKSLVPIQPGGSKPPLYCVHAAGGFVLFYRDLAKYLGVDQPLYGLQAQGLDGQGTRHRRVEEMAAHYIEEMRAFQPQGPYYLGGECFGGRIAFEMARQLRGQGQEVGLLALFNTFGPGYPQPLPGTTALHRRMNSLRLRFIDHHLANLRLLSRREQLWYLQTKVLERLQPWRDAKSRGERLKRLAGRIFDGPFRSVGKPLPEALQHTQDSLIEANISYTPQPYAGRVTLFRASKQPPGIRPDPTLGWRDLATGGLDIHDIPGSAIVLEPRVRLLAERLKVCLDQAQAAPKP
jgi:amino acid adenylation domain-containing protein